MLVLRQYGKFPAQKKFSLDISEQEGKEPRCSMKVTHSYYSLIKSCRAYLFSRTQLSYISPLGSVM